MSLAILFHLLCVQHVQHVGVVSVLQASACNTDTTPTQPYRNSNTYRNKNNTTNMVIQQNSRKLLMMDILMPETCWTHKKWNKIASDIKLVFYFSNITQAFIKRSRYVWYFHTQIWPNYCNIITGISLRVSNYGIEFQRGWEEETPSNFLLIVGRNMTIKSCIYKKRYCW